MSEFLLSVIMPVYNTAAYLDRSIGSILDQVADGCEVILVDDGSTDESGAQCDDYGNAHGCVTVVHQANSGVSAARNAGIELARGRYVWFCDSDDRMLPGAYGRLCACLEDGLPEMVAFPVVQEDEEGHELGLIPAPHAEGYGSRGPLQSNDLLYPYAHVISRSLIGGDRFDTSLSLLEDRDFLYRICSKVKGDITTIEEPLYAYLITRGDSAVNSLPVERYVAANDVQFRILRKELELGRPEPAYTIAASHTIGVLSLICKTNRCSESFSTLRERLLSFDEYSWNLSGLLRLKYVLCRDAVPLFKAAYALYGKIHKGRQLGDTVLVKPSTQDGTDRKEGEVQSRGRWV